MKQRILTLALTVGIAILAMPGPASAHIPLDKRVCVIGVSKQMCAMRLFGGNWGPYTCSLSGGQCQTLTGVGATFSGPITNGAGSSCNEVAQEWQLTATVDVNSRGDQPMPARGSIVGRFQLTDPNLGTLLASGDLYSTLGVGTHRPGICGDACGKDCEGCYDASFDGVSTWVIGSEGMIVGEFVAGRYAGCRIRWSYQGDFTALGDAYGPSGPGWGFCGNLDGVIECPCDTV